MLALAPLSGTLGFQIARAAAPAALGVLARGAAARHFGAAAQPAPDLEPQCDAYLSDLEVAAPSTAPAALPVGNVHNWAEPDPCR